jgi:hypothetical protein
VGFTRERAAKDGKPRFVALYRDLKGRQRPAGTYASKRLSDREWQRAEARLELGRVGDPGKGRQTFRRYVEETWLPNHEVEATTRQSYTYGGRADRAAGARHRVRSPDADREPGGGQRSSAVPSRGRPVPGQGIPEGRGVPAAQAQRADHRQAEGTRDPAWAVTT